MSTFQDRVRDWTPHSVHSFAIGVFNAKQYRARRSGVYKEYLEYHARVYSESRDWIEAESGRRLEKLLKYARSNSKFYRSRLEGLPDRPTHDDLASIPILHKQDLVDSVDAISTLKPNEPHIVSYTGGTTGASLKVLYRIADMQERQATLDSFRMRFGYKPRAKTVWFSGRDFLSMRDRRNDRYSKHDRFENTLFVSTFDISQRTAALILEQIADFSPEFFVGWPSSISALANYVDGSAKATLLDRISPKAVFPTAETVTDMLRQQIEDSFKTRVADQYASSEGAPFITECHSGGLHLNPLSGVFEVLDEDDKPASRGRLVVTSFTTSGTPLIRYDVRDEVVRSSRAWCECGQQTPLVETILGRPDDYALAADGRQVNLVHLSNCARGVPGIYRMQVQQRGLGDVAVLVEASSDFDAAARELFDAQLRIRLGTSAKIDVRTVARIPLSKSGKFRLVIHEGDA